MRDWNSINWDSYMEFKNGYMGVTSEYDRLYREFMFDPDNEYHCHGCPENSVEREGITRTQGNPCGQQHCWVACHCNNE